MLLKILIKPRNEECFSQASFDEDMYWVCDFNYPHRKMVPENLSEQISGTYNLNWRSYRVDVDRFDMAFSRFESDTFFRIDDIYAYIGPVGMVNVEIDSAPQNLESCYFEFVLPEDDDLHSLHGSITILHDALNKRSCLKITESGSPVNWFRISDNAAIATDSTGNLALMQFEMFEVNLEPGPQE